MPLPSVMRCEQMFAPKNDVSKGKMIYLVSTCVDDHWAADFITMGGIASPSLFTLMKHYVSRPNVYF